MGESGAQRQARHRRHKAGDHELCIPGNCAVVTPDVTDVVTAEQRHAEPERPRLGETGSQLWNEMTADGPLPSMAMVLLLEACRIADRLDQLDENLRGGVAEWLQLEVDGNTTTVIIDRALSESRQQATALKGLIAEIRQFTGKGKPRQGGQEQGTQQKGGGTIADLASRIAERRGESAG